jgi:integrase
MPVTRKELEKISLRKAIEDYLECATFKRKRSSANERVALEALLDRETSLCSKSLAEITQKDFADYRDRRLETIKPSTLRRELNPLRSMFKIARREWNLPIDNPLQGLWLPAEGAHRERRLTYEERKAIFKAIDSCRSSKQVRLWFSMVLAALQTALRRGELLRLQLSDIDFEKSTLYVRPGKTGKSRLLPMANALRAHLWLYRDSIPESHRTPEARVFPITLTAHSRGPSVEHGRNI